MSLRFGVPSPPRIHHPEFFFAAIAISLAALLLTTFIVDKLGTAMFKRGFAKPFYIKGHRIHHDCIYFIVLPDTPCFWACTFWDTSKYTGGRSMQI